MEHVIASVYMAALMVCHFNWHLFLARENRGAGNTDRATEHLADARHVMDDLKHLHDVWAEAAEEAEVSE